jgi:hypothetical protein
MTQAIKNFLSRYNFLSAGGGADPFVSGMGKVISLNSQTDFSGKIASLRLTEQEMLAKDARRIGKDMWEVLQK